MINNEGVILEFFIIRRPYLFQSVVLHFLAEIVQELNNP